MRSANKIHVVLLQEAGHNIGTKGEGDTSVVLTPASDIFVGIGPQEIAKQAAIRNLPFSLALVRASRPPTTILCDRKT